MKIVYYGLELVIACLIISNLMRMSESTIPIFTCVGIIFSACCITIAINYLRKAIWEKWDSQS